MSGTHGLFTPSISLSLRCSFKVATAFASAISVLSLSFPTFFYPTHLFIAGCLFILPGINYDEAFTCQTSGIWSGVLSKLSLCFEFLIFFQLSTLNSLTLGNAS
jgi:hypothetical protein